MDGSALNRQSRRDFLVAVRSLAGVSLLPLAGCARPDKIRVGFMLPYSGTYAKSRVFWIALPVGIAMSMLLGMLLELLFVRRLDRRDHLQQVLLTYRHIPEFSPRCAAWSGVKTYTVMPYHFGHCRPQDRRDQGRVGA